MSTSRLSAVHRLHDTALSRSWRRPAMRTAAALVEASESNPQLRQILERVTAGGLADEGLGPTGSLRLLGLVSDEAGDEAPAPA